MKACLKENTRAVYLQQIRIVLNTWLDTPPLLKRIGFYAPIKNNFVLERYFDFAGNRIFDIELQSVNVNRQVLGNLFLPEYYK